MNKENDLRNKLLLKESLNPDSLTDEEKIVLAKLKEDFSKETEELQIVKDVKEAYIKFKKLIKGE
jgi:hypothetical protein